MKSICTAKGALSTMSREPTEGERLPATIKQVADNHNKEITAKISWAAVAPAFDPSTWEVEAGGSLSLRLAWLTVSFRTVRATQRYPCLEKHNKTKHLKNSSSEKVKRTINKWAEVDTPDSASTSLDSSFLAECLPSCSTRPSGSVFCCGHLVIWCFH